MKINLLNTAHGLFPCTDDDQENKLKLKVGEVYQVNIKMFRNYEFHKKYFALINLAWEYLNEKQTEFYHNDKEVFRKSIEVTAGHCDKVFNHSLKSWIDYPKSIAFDKMDNAEFQDLYSKVKNVIFELIIIKLNITEEEFMDNLIHF